MRVDTAVVATLVASHRRFLSFLERRVENRDVAEEILQAALARAIEKGSDLQSRESSVAWFFRLLRNAVVDHYRRRAARERLLEACAAEVVPEASVDDELHREVCACFSVLLPTLKPEYATMIQSVDLDGRAVSELAQELGITSNNAGIRLHRARQALKRRIEQVCATCAEHGCLECTCQAKTH